MTRDNIKREVDLQLMSQWIAPGSRVLDLGCGRGVQLEYLKSTRNVYCVGVDRDQDKVTHCVQRGINAYQGDAADALAIFKDKDFDWVICSRMLHELESPARVLAEATRVGKNVAVGFVNFGFWETRWSMLVSGQRPKNEVYPHSWHESRPYNPLSIKDFEHFCAQQNYVIEHRVFLDSSWRRTIQLLPNLLAGYAVYAITQPNKPLA